MSDLKHPDNKESNKYARWEVFSPLIADDADQAGFRTKNEPGEFHRVLITGYDCSGMTAVHSRLFYVVHSIIGNRNTNPATLLVAPV
ncbi:hypothetical protein F4825DRAFT_417493 [Nemania diffusa]|nr:hypothetical protein F4825DRAFT_417493 [Nemania diffusa]